MYVRTVHISGGRDRRLCIYHMYDTIKRIVDKIYIICMIQPKDLFEDQNLDFSSFCLVFHSYFDNFYLYIRSTEGDILLVIFPSITII